MDSLDRRTRGESSLPSARVRSFNVGLLALGSLLFVNGVGIGITTAFVPFAVNTLLVIVLSTGLFVLGAVWIVRSGGIGSNGTSDDNSFPDRVRRARNGRSSGTRRSRHSGRGGL
ncbi:hypothetical protein [Natronorarus salvus]|uniref:hypothetical protein n=1 Tax=Natronorarus salvus TaxID=3117733 RepID=UPI002F263252